MIFLHSLGALSMATQAGVFSVRTTSYRWPFLTVPLLWSLRRRRFDAKRADQIQGGVTQTQAVQRGPKIDHVPLLLTARLEAMEDVVTHVDAARAASSVGAMDRTCATLLRPRSLQTSGDAQVLEDTRHRQLLLDVREVEERVLAQRRFVC